MYLYLIIVTITISGLIFGYYKRKHIWLKGNAPTEPLATSLLLTIPKRYFIDLHHIVVRDQTSSWMHILLAGGLVALLLFLVLSIFLIGDSYILYFIVVTPLTLCVILGLVLHSKRQQQKKLSATNNLLSEGAFKQIPLVISGFLLGLWLTILFDNSIIYTIGAFLLIFCTIQIFWSSWLDKPLKHIISGSVHLAFHKRQDRFKKKLSSNLMSIPVTTKIGANQIGDFSWNQVLSFDACIECGRCQSVCPAFAAGQPLNPKKVIQDLLLSATNQPQSCYHGADYPNLKNFIAKENPKPENNSQLSKHISDHTLYACTTCRACVYECPMMIEHVDSIIDMRRYRTMTHGAYNDNAQEVLDNLRHTDTVSGLAKSERHNWATGIGVSIAEPNSKHNILLLAGESGFDLKAQNTLKKLAELILTTGQSVAIMENEPDVGDLARRMGEEAEFQRLANNMINKLKLYQFDTIVTNDPHIYHSIKNEYPELGGQFKIAHHTEYLYELIQKNKLKVEALNESTTYHDPCYLGRYNDVIDTPRALLDAIGVQVVEMEKSGCKSRCCGWGGGAVYSDVAGDKRIPDMRMDDVRSTQQDQVVVACPNCMTMLDGVIDPKPQVIDIVELVNKATTR